MDHVAQAVGVPRHDGVELGVRGATLGLGKVDRDLQPGVPRGAERRCERRHVALGRVPAQVDADDALAGELAGQGHNLVGLGGRVAPVHGQDEAHVDGRVVALGGGGGVQHGLDIAGLGQAGGRHGARRGPQLEVDDAVVGELAHDRPGRVLERLGVVDEVVDVGGEEREEAVTTFSAAFPGEGENGFTTYVLRS